MIRYIIRRLLLFIPTLIVISLLAFIISVNAPGDPLDIVLNSSSNNSEAGISLSSNQLILKDYWRKKLGLDLPLFYLGIKSFAEPDTIYKVFDKEERYALERLINMYGNWDDIQKYYLSINTLLYQLNTLNTDSINFKTDLTNARYAVSSLKTSYDDIIILNSIEKINQFVHSYPQLLASIIPQFEDLKSNYSSIKTNSTKWKNFMPSIAFHGLHNQYHKWLFGDESTNSKGLIRGDFGTSYITKQPVSEIIYKRLGWTFFFSFTSIVLAYLISIPIGIKAAAHKGKLFDRISSVLLFMLFSMPIFWMATLLLMTFANPDVFKIFKASGVRPLEGFSSNMSLWDKITISIPYLVLPTICYTYSSLAFIARSMRVSMVETLSLDFIRTAHAKGLSEYFVIYKHALRNSLFPIINLFATLFPAIISGSIILESIFSIPGMGTETIAAIEAKNYPMIVAIFTLTGILTLTGFLISDLLFKLTDSRIDLEK
jgi:peptide/nickel transport system permease protein